MFDLKLRKAVDEAMGMLLSPCASLNTRVENALNVLREGMGAVEHYPPFVCRGCSTKFYHPHSILGEGHTDCVLNQRQFCCPACFDTYQDERNKMKRNLKAKHFAK